MNNVAWTRSDLDCDAVVELDHGAMAGLDLRSEVNGAVVYLHRGIVVDHGAATSLVYGAVDNLDCGVMAGLEARPKPKITRVEQAGLRISMVELVEQMTTVKPAKEKASLAVAGQAESSGQTMSFTGVFSLFTHCIVLKG